MARVYNDAWAGKPAQNKKRNGPKEGKGKGQGQSEGQGQGQEQKEGEGE